MGFAISPLLKFMGKMEKIVLIKNAVETLGYFSEQIALELQEQGLEVYFVDYEDLYESMEGLKQFVTRGDTAIVTFNFIGYSGEDVFLQESGGTIWEAYGMSAFNILVDHPLYYHSKLMQAPEKMTVSCLDREHVQYIKRFYPGIKVKFLPTAGNILLEQGWDYEEQLIPYGERKYDVVFTANYVPFQKLYRRFDEMDEEYAAFYRGILDDLIAQPAQSVDVVMERHITAELGELADADIRTVISGMLLVDLCARTYYRGEIIKELAEQDIKVHVFGADWDQLSCKKPENIIQNGKQVGSGECVRAVRDAKIALNVMPWFKDGVHDRIFTAMLQKAVALTDDSKYLREQFTDGEDIVYFSLEEREHLPDIIRMLLRDEEKLMRIAEKGYRQACEKHTWRVRTQELLREFGG